MKTKSKLSYVLLASLLTFASCSEDNPFFNDNQEQEQEQDHHTIDDLQGTWLRTGGDNTNNEGMIVKVTNTTGVILDPVDSGFQIDDVKWKSIANQTAGGFTHLELGSDYNYYGATIDFQSENVIRIVVDAGGTGNYQEWTRQ